VCVFSTGPTAFWRHSAIGAGRSEIPSQLTPNNIQRWQYQIRDGVIWQADGVEAGVAITASNGLSFLVNGKNDGNAIWDAGTQIGLGLLPAILHPEPQTCLIVGLGTGETAGWLAKVDSVKQVDVVEIEPVIAEMARRCAGVNGEVLQNPKVRVIYNDAREVLLTTKEKYDLIASEPSNPYRAGIANLFTREFYLSVDSRLKPKGLFVQWLQAYEIDDITISTVVATLKSVFNYVELWQSNVGDILLLCSQEPIVYDSGKIRERMSQEPFKTAFGRAWRATQIEGFLSRYIGGNMLSDELAKDYKKLLNTDDLNRVEYGFARTLGHRTGFSTVKLHEKAILLFDQHPKINDEQIDWEGVEDERMAISGIQGNVIPFFFNASPGQVKRGQALQKCLDKNYTDTISLWELQPRQAKYPTDTALLALAYAETGNPKSQAFIDRLQSFDKSEAELLQGIFLKNQGRYREAADVLSQAFVTLRTNPWALYIITENALDAAQDVMAQDASQAPKLVEALKEPFSVMYMEWNRKGVGCFAASRIGAKETLPWLESYEPNVRWDESFLQLRLQVYISTGNALESRARSDLELYKTQESKE
jgi:spermidine synthase